MATAVGKTKTHIRTQWINVPLWKISALPWSALWGWTREPLRSWRRSPVPERNDPWCSVKKDHCDKKVSQQSSKEIFLTSLLTLETNLKRKRKRKKVDLLTIIKPELPYEIMNESSFLFRFSIQTCTVFCMILMTTIFLFTTNFNIKSCLRYLLHGNIEIFKDAQLSQIKRR